MQIQIRQEINAVFSWIDQLFLSKNYFLGFLDIFPELWLFQITNVALKINAIGY